MFATRTEHISKDLVALPDTGKEDKRGGMVVHNNVTECISMDCFPQGDDAEAEEEEDIYVVVHNRTQHNRTERNTNCVPQGDDTEAVTDS